MNKILTTFLLTFVSLLTLSSQTQYNLAFETDSDPGKLNVVLKVSFDAAAQLSSSNLQFNYSGGIANPMYFGGPLGPAMGYTNISVTEPVANRASLNIVWQNFANGLDIPVGDGNEIAVGIIQFDIVDENLTPDLIWAVSEGTQTVVTSTQGAGMSQNPIEPGTLSDANGVSLPIELSEFTAKKRGESASILDWTTKTEINSSHFEIERAMDGVSFETLGKENAAGNSLGTLSYQFADANVPLKNGETIAYYRLKMVDIDGAYEYSETRAVSFEGHGDVVTIHPNPTVNFINVDAQLDIERVTIYDTAGKVVFNQTTNVSTIDMTGYDSGMYKVVVSTEAGDQVKSVVKID